MRVESKIAGAAGNRRHQFVDLVGYLKGIVRIPGRHDRIALVKDVDTHRLLRFVRGVHCLQAGKGT